LERDKQKTGEVNKKEVSGKLEEVKSNLAGDKQQTREGKKPKENRGGVNSKLEEINSKLEEGKPQMEADKPETDEYNIC
jgi:hypothetical protein